MDVILLADFGRFYFWIKSPNLVSYMLISAIFLISNGKTRPIITGKLRYLPAR